MDSEEINVSETLMDEETEKKNKKDNKKIKS